MLYRVILKQKIKYDETVVGHFDNFVDVMNFARSIIEHFDSVTITIEKVDFEEVRKENGDGVEL